MLLSRLLQCMIGQHWGYLLNINERRMHITLCICTSSVLTVNLYFICLQIEKVILDHLPVEHVWNLLSVFYNFVEKIIVSDFCISQFVLLQVHRLVFLPHLLIDQIWRLSWKGLELLFLTCYYSKVISWSI